MEFTLGFALCFVFHKMYFTSSFYTSMFQKIIFAVFAVFFTQNIWAEEVKVASEVKEVTLYLTGAKVSSGANVALTAGTSEIVFKDLPTSIQTQSLQVKIKGNADLLSVKYRAHVPEPLPEFKANAQIEAFQDSIASRYRATSRLAEQKNLLIQEENLVIQNSNRVHSTTKINGTDVSLFTMEDLKNLTEYYHNRLLFLQKEKFQIDDLHLLHEKKIAYFQKKIAEMQTEDNKKRPKPEKMTGEIVLQVNSQFAQSVEIVCVYLIAEASWYPVYDLSSEGTDKPVKLVYKAAIRQLSGYDWKNVKIHLSTANPNISSTRPILQPLYLTYQVIYQQPQIARERSEAYSLNMATNAAPMKEDMAKEVKPTTIVTTGGAELPFDQIQNGLEIANNAEAKIELDVPFQQSIYSNNEFQIVKVEEHELKAEYEYHTVPRMDAGVFLLAKITDYGQYNLTSGNANIFYQGTYLGQSYIDTRSVSDTLLLSLGRDENVSVKRLQLQELSKTQLIGTSKKEYFGYEIIVKNNRRNPINIEILDEVPVSKNTEIEVTFDGAEGANYVKEYGKLSWKMTIPANSSKKVKFSYFVKYPKDKALNYFH